MKPLPVSMWAREDIPAYKVQDMGVEALSTSELLSIIIGTGNANETQVDLAKRIMAKCHNNLKELSKLSVRDLSGYQGIGEQKAAKILAAVEIGRRWQMEQAQDKFNLSTPTSIYNHMLPQIGYLDEEEFWILMLNQNKSLIKKVRISHGGITETAVDVRVILRECVLNNATILVCCHNHPSGSLRPSRCDNNLTDSIKKACEIMRIYFMDHVIVTDGSYYSYHEQGHL